jgi:hypothetical protein
MSSRVLLSVFLATILLHSAVLPQSQPARLSARELFYTSPAAKKPQMKNRGQTARTALQHSEGGLAAALAKLTPIHLRYGRSHQTNGRTQRVRYLYIVQQGASGKWKVLFPDDQSASRGNRIEKSAAEIRRRRLSILPTCRDEKLFVVLSREPEADWDNHPLGRRPRR